MIRFKELETLKAEVRSLIIINYEYASLVLMLYISGPETKGVAG